MLMLPGMLMLVLMLVLVLMLMLMLMLPLILITDANNIRPLIPRSLGEDSSNTSTMYVGWLVGTRCV